MATAGTPASIFACRSCQHRSRPIARRSALATPRGDQSPDRRRGNGQRARAVSPVQRVIDDVALIGTPDHVIASSWSATRTAGVTHVFARLSLDDMPPEVARTTIDLLGRHVIPRFASACNKSAIILRRGSSESLLAVSLRMTRRDHTLDNAQRGHRVRRQLHATRAAIFYLHWQRPRRHTIGRGGGVCCARTVRGEQLRNSAGRFYAEVHAHVRACGQVSIDQRDRQSGVRARCRAGHRGRADSARSRRLRPRRAAPLRRYAARAGETRDTSACGTCARHR